MPVIEIRDPAGDVINTIVATPEFADEHYPGAWRLCAVQPAQPVADVPQRCTRRQGQLALLSYGLLDGAEAAIAAIADPLERRAAQIEYDADTWERSNAFLSQLWVQLGGTPETLDEAFARAVTL